MPQCGDHPPGEARGLLQIAFGPELYSSNISFSAARPPKAISQPAVQFGLANVDSGLLRAAVA